MVPQRLQVIFIRGSDQHGSRISLSKDLSQKEEDADDSYEICLFFLR